MKQGKHYTNLILWIFLAAIIAYFGYNVASSLSEPLTTSTAIEYEAGAGCYDGLRRARRGDPHLRL